jgi:hypothetical protein
LEEEEKRWRFLKVVEERKDEVKVIWAHSSEDNWIQKKDIQGNMWVPTRKRKRTI